MSAPRARFYPWLAGILGMGAALRLIGLSAQVLVGDEYWDVRAALYLPLEDIFQTLVFDAANICIPLAASYRVLMDLGVPVTEFHLRLPALASGLVALVLLPVMMRPRVGASAALGFAALLAASPTLVLYGRISRYYMLAVTLAFAALWAFERWQTRGTRRSAAGYVLLAALAIYVHLLAAPFVLAPVAVEFLRRLVRARGAGRAGLLQTVALAMAVLAVVTLLLWPARESILWLLQERSRTRPPGPDAMVGVLALWTGTAAWPWVVALLAAALRGLVKMVSSVPSLAATTASAFAAQLGALFVIAPAGFDEAILFNRYSLFVVPVLLLWAAVGFTAPLSERWRARLPRRVGASLPAVATAVVAGGILISSPLGVAGVFSGSFGHAAIFRRFDREPPRVDPERTSPFYSNLEALPDGAVLEFPWHRVVFPARAEAHQAIHGRPVVAVYGRTAAWGDPRLALQNSVVSEWPALLASRGRYLVIHLRPDEEERQVGERRGYHEAAMWRSKPLVDRLRSEAADLAREAAERFGPPLYADAWVRVWDLRAEPDLAP